jgi:hypothetical protein
MFARGLAAASERGLGGGALRGMANEYAAIGRDWTAFAVAALPASERLFADTRSTLDDRLARYRAGASVEELRWQSDRLEQLAEDATDGFPLTERESVELLTDLASQLRAIAARERAALDELEAAIGD